MVTLQGLCVFFAGVQFIARSATVRELKCAMNRAATVCATG